MATKKLDPVHPGEILQKSFWSRWGSSQNRLALALGVPARRINEIVLGKRGITADTALRLARYFKMSPQFWLVCRWTTNWMWQRTYLKADSKKKSNLCPLQDKRSAWVAILQSLHFPISPSINSEHFDHRSADPSISFTAGSRICHPLGELSYLRLFRMPSVECRPDTYVFLLALLSSLKR